MKYIVSVERIVIARNAWNMIVKRRFRIASALATRAVTASRARTGARISHFNTNSSLLSTSFLTHSWYIVLICFIWRLNISMLCRTQIPNLFFFRRSVHICPSMGQQPVEEVGSVKSSSGSISSLYAFFPQGYWKSIPSLDLISVDHRWPLLQL